MTALAQLGLRRSIQERAQVATRRRLCAVGSPDRTIAEPDKAEIPHSPAYNIASTRDELHGAFSLVYRTYLEKGYLRPNRTGMRILPHHVLDSTDVFVARRGADVLGTMTLVGDHRLPLPMEDLYGEEIAAFRAMGDEVAEVSSLASSHDGRAGSTVVIELIRLMMQTARLRGVDRLVIAVHPRHVEFYRRFIGFEVCGPRRAYAAVCSQPALPLTLNFAAMPIRNRRAYRRFFGKPIDEAVLQRPRIRDSVRAEMNAWLLAQQHGDLHASHAPPAATRDFSMKVA